MEFVLQSHRLLIVVPESKKWKELVKMVREEKNVLKKTKLLRSLAKRQERIYPIVQKLLENGEILDPASRRRQKHSVGLAFSASTEIVQVERECKNAQRKILSSLHPAGLQVPNYQIVQKSYPSGIMWALVSHQNPTVGVAQGNKHSDELVGMDPEMKYVQRMTWFNSYHVVKQDLDYQIVLRCMENGRMLELVQR